MLLQFTVENFLSFRDRTTFSMLVPEGSTAPEKNWVEVGGYKVLRAAAMYGANAAGKSNFAHALLFCSRLIVTGTAVGEPLHPAVFRLDAARRVEPARFEFEVIAEGSHYSYGFIADEGSVRSEWLFRSSAQAETEELVFDLERAPGRPDTPRFTLGPSFGESAERARFVAEGTRHNQLFLHEAAERNLRELMPVFNWFAGGLRIILPDTRYQGLVLRVRDDLEFRRSLVHALARVDTGIRSLSTVSAEVTVAPALRTVYEKASRDGGLEDEGSSIIQEDGSFSQVSLRTTRQDTAGNEVSFGAKQESDGTQRFMHLAPALFENGSGARSFVIDELDRSLHTLLARQFVEDFLAGDRNNERQLIFTTHDTNLLTRDLLPPEAIWFAEKDAGGATALYSLAEFNQEQIDQLGPSLEAGYLAGRFGAIPFIADRTRLGWERGRTS